MAEQSQQAVTLTFEQLKELLAATQKLNPLEQRAYDKQLEQERRKALAGVELGKIEEEAIRRKKYGCSHCRYPSGHRLAGHDAPRGEGEWCTGGQIHTDGTVTVICVRCSTYLRFQPTHEERNYIENTGGWGMAFPDWSRELKPCPQCSKFFAGKAFDEHVEPCQKAAIKAADALITK